MEIAKFKDIVRMLEVQNSQGKKRWLVIYGMQVVTHATFEAAFAGFTECAHHAATCDGYYD